MKVSHVSCIRSLIRLKARENRGRKGTRGSARAQKGLRHLFWDRAHAAERPQPLRTCPLLLRLRLELRIPFLTPRPDRRSSMHETHMTQRDPDFNEQSGNAHPYVHPSLPLVSPNSLYALSNLRQSSQLIFSRWGNPRESVCRVPGGYSKPAQGYSASARGYSEDARELHLKAPALMCSRNSRGRESAAQGAVEEGVEEAFRPPEFY